MGGAISKVNKDGVIKANKVTKDGIIKANKVNKDGTTKVNKDGTTKANKDGIISNNTTVTNSFLPSTNFTNWSQDSTTSLFWMFPKIIIATNSINSLSTRITTEPIKSS